MITILAIILIAILLYKIYVLRKQNQEVIQINQENQKKNQEIEQQINSKKQELKSVKENINTQTNILSSIQETNKAMREEASKLAEQEYQARVSALNEKYNQSVIACKDAFDKKVNEYKIAIDKETAKLEDLKSKQLAYIQEKLREEEMKAQENYYKLVISDEDNQDIELLRSIQGQFAHKEAIDKLVWDGYYKSAYDVLMSHLFKKSGKICGIYKITDLITGQSYIGQSVDIRERFRQHIKSGLSSAPATNKLYQAMRKDELWNFTFEILEEVPKDKLNEREIYWIDFYQTKTYGMNKTAGGA